MTAFLDGPMKPPTASSLNPSARLSTFGGESIGVHAQGNGQGATASPTASHSTPSTGSLTATV